MTAPWYAGDTRRCLAAQLGGTVELEPAEVDWDRRAVCRAVLPGGRRAVLKIDRDGARHAREVAGLDAAARAAAPVPEVLWRGRGAHWILALAEIPARGSLRTLGGAWREAGAAARALHAAEIPPGLPMFCDGAGSWAAHLARRFAIETDLAIDRGLLTRAEAAAANRHARRALGAAGPADPVLLHGDLQARHVLIEGAPGRVVLVDLGDAGWGDPALDLVVLTHLDLDHRDEVLDGYGAGAALRRRIAILGATYSLWRNLFVSRWYFENAFEQRRNTEVARAVLERDVLPHDRPEAAW